MWCNICSDEGSSHHIIMYGLNMCLQCWCWCAKLWPAPLFPECSGEEERWHWSWVRSTDLRCPHPHHWPGHSAASSGLAPSGHSLHFTNHIGCIGNFSCRAFYDVPWPFVLIKSLVAICDINMHWYSHSMTHQSPYSCPSDQFVIAYFRHY